MPIAKKYWKNKVRKKAGLHNLSVSTIERKKNVIQYIFSVPMFAKECWREIEEITLYILASRIYGRLISGIITGKILLRIPAM